MTRKYLALCIFLCCANRVNAQQYGLFNTKTLFDGFENPAQKTFVLDSSRQFASNFFLPYFGIHAAIKGNENVFRTLVKEGIYSTEDVPLGTGKVNTFFQYTNIYLLNFKLFQSYKYHKEIGLSWQVRADAHINYTNETLAVIDNYRRLADSTSRIFNNAFNTSGYAQSYHQFSFTYRENYDKRLAFGVKLSLLSGITYNRGVIDKSYFALESENGPLTASLRGSYRASFLKGNQLGKRTVLPLFKNPGASVSFGTSYIAKSGFFVMANVKDLGFLKWSKSSYVSEFDNTSNPLVLDSLLYRPASNVTDAVTGIMIKDRKQSGFYTPTNAKADIMISKSFGFYTPSLIVSKNLFYKGGDVAVVNKFYNSNFSLSLIPAYNYNNMVLFGAQGMYQTPNFEVFLGSDNLFKTTSLLLGKNAEDSGVSRSYNSASIYLGASIKFGYVVEHPQNSSYMPGIDDEQKSFFRGLFGIFKGRKK